MDLLNIVLREEFVKLYTIDVLDRFKEQAEAQIGEPVPDAPLKGDFDISLVRESEFVFA
jgi:DNA-directed RNA polymerase